MTDAFPNNWRPRIVQTVATGSAYPETREVLDPTSLAAENAILKAEVARLSKLVTDGMWRDTALSAAVQIIGAPEIESVLTPVQYGAWERIKQGLKVQENTMPEMDS